MKSAPDAAELQRLADMTMRRAKDLPPGPDRDQLYAEARNYAEKARSDGWRASSLHAPE